jgi:DNA-binding PadR family transcriptional regulator
MALHHALLSLLEEGESYGYELKAVFERSVGPQWGALNIGHLYQVLDRLKRDGHVTIVRSEPQPRRPDRLIYAITDSGRRELSDWLRTPSTTSGYRDDLYFKLLAGARAGNKQLAAVIGRERTQLLAELHALEQLAAREDDPLCSLLNQGAALQVEARLKLLDLAERDAALLVQTAQRHPVQGQTLADSQAAGPVRRGAG